MTVSFNSSLFWTPPGAHSVNFPVTVPTRPDDSWNPGDYPVHPDSPVVAWDNVKFNTLGSIPPAYNPHQIEVNTPDWYGEIVRIKYRVSGTVSVRGVSVRRDVCVLGLIDGKLAVTGDTYSDPVDGYGVLFETDDPSKAYVIAIDDYGIDWEPLLPVNLGWIIHPPTPNGFVYHCTEAGVLGDTEPEWWLDYDDSQAARQIGTAWFKAVQYLRPQVIQVTPEPVEV